MKYIEYSRNQIEEAQDQLERGEKIFRQVISPLAELSSTWRHRGLICLPNIESREYLLQQGFSQEDIQVNTLLWSSNLIFSQN